jgi:transcriptional regulator with XRE-family HTH domain
MREASGMQLPSCTPLPVVAEWLAMSDRDEIALPLGERLKHLRQEHGWSQADLAAKVGTDPGQISRYENGKMTPSAEAVVRLAEILDVTTDYLLIETSPRRPLHAPENILGDRLNTVSELTEDELAVVLSVIDGLVAKNRLRTLAGGLT